jgi:hypothetical protein
LASGGRIPPGTTLRLRRVRRNHSLSAMVPFLVSLLALSFAALLFEGCKQKIDFTSQGLPADLPSYLGQLRTLKVPASVTRLDWLPETLEELDASNTAIQAMSYVPPSLKRLDLSKAKDLIYLSELPPSLRELDIRYTKLQGPWRLSEQLETLHLGGEYVQTLEGLNKSLLELTIDNAHIKSIASLPSFLQSLSISGSASEDSAPFLKDLGKLPPHLKELRLTNTNIAILKALPLTLRSLTLKNNGTTDVEPPRFLIDLTLAKEHPRMSSLDQLNFLNRLDEVDSSGLNVLPPFLRDLRVTEPDSTTQKLPSSLRSIWFMNDNVLSIPPLPQSLEDLRWRGASILKGLPPNLKRLDISSSTLVDVANLQVQSLDVSNTTVPFDKLPPRLQNLRFRFCPFTIANHLPRSLHSLDLSGSPRLVALDVSLLPLERLDISQTALSKMPLLPPTLKQLDISNSKISDIKNLPKGLLSLTVHKGQLSSLAGLPSSVTELYFLEQEIK